MKRIEQHIKEIISKQLGIPLEDVQNEKKFIDDLGGESLDTVELVLTLEDEFGIEVQEEDAEGIDTVQKVIDFVTRIKS